MELGPLLATGNTAEVYVLDDERILKQFDEGVPVTAIQREAANTRTAAAAGLPVPTVCDVTEVDGCHAVIFERVQGEPMLDELAARPWTVRRNARLLAMLHVALHDTVYPDGPDVRDRLRDGIKAAAGLTAAERTKLLDRVDALPDGNTMCHGDFHPGNVMLTGTTPVIIDWLDARRGHPAADVARSDVLMRFTARVAGPVRGPFVRLFQWWYHRAYFSRSAMSPGEIRAWELPVAAARITEGVPEGPLLRDYVKSRLTNG